MFLVLSGFIFNNHIFLIIDHLSELQVSVVPLDNFQVGLDRIFLLEHTSLDIEEK